ncbi:MAG: glycine cleavage system aminomethyltransferase GcvT [Verrucomicrobia bacterium]|jgi:aminomethyltransferase|nr:glycine cleavage system aminomethyltransferase GcvT [Verrucomicrobiota bacterium]MDA1202775.1 glycine cleavage system aminomethyltransferase GcvT [Verrucomicrobiota bacterium]
MEATNRRTALYEQQKSAGARCINFGGWEMPVQFTSIMDEHHAVRTACGVFDISHMGEVFVLGPQALDWLQGMLAGDLSKCPADGAQYTFLLNERGGVIDDLIVYRIADDNFLLLVNAAKIAEDVAWLQRHVIDGVTIDNRSDTMSALAVQGPDAPRIFREVFQCEMPVRNTFVAMEKCRGAVIAAGTGYTGEIGFELFFSNALAGDVWGAVLQAGAKPCGLGARDTLRLEMCYPLNGSDLSPGRTPLEAGLGMFVALDKREFMGRDALLAQKAAGLTSKLVGLRMTEKSPPPRAHYPVLVDGQVVGETTSGVLSPSLNEGIAMAYLPLELAKPGQIVQIDIRGRWFAAVVAKKPFYRPSSPRPA